MSELRARLTEHFLAEGFVVKEEEIYPAKGHYRSSPYADCFRWEAFGHAVGGGPTVYFTSWTTMTLCVKRGIVLTKDNPTSFDVSAKAEDGQKQVPKARVPKV